MFLSLLTSKPLAIAAGVLLLTTAAEAWKIADLYQKLGASHAECVVARQADAAAVTAMTEALSSESLRTQIADTKKHLAKSQETTRSVAKRNATQDEILKTYRQALDAARKTDETLDLPLSDSVTKRLRDVEADYDRGPTRSR